MSYHSLSRHRISVDGTGVTTLVPFHGCPLNCKYCLNPQALSASGVWKSLSSEELLKTVRQDDLYFRATNGKITLAVENHSCQCQHILSFCQHCLENGNHCHITIESSLNVELTEEVKDGFCVGKQAIKHADRNKVNATKCNCLWQV